MRKDWGQSKNQGGNQEPGKYVDILFLPHPVSKKHPPMDRSVRAAQFSPFAALTGYEAAVQEAGRLTDRFVELEEYERAVLDQSLQQLKQCLRECSKQNCSEWPVITVTYFQPDARKEGGAYVQICGSIRRIDEYRRVLVMGDGAEIPLDLVLSLTKTDDFEKFRTDTRTKMQ